MQPFSTVSLVNRPSGDVYLDVTGGNGAITIGTDWSGPTGTTGIVLHFNALTYATPQRVYVYDSPTDGGDQQHDDDHDLGSVRSPTKLPRERSPSSPPTIIRCRALDLRI